jgi:hypothetical protein
MQVVLEGSVLPAGDKCCIDGQPASFLMMRSPFNSSNPYAALANEQYRAPCCMMLRSTALRPLPVQNTQERIAMYSVSDGVVILDCVSQGVGSPLTQEVRHACLHSTCSSSTVLQLDSITVDDCLLGC